MALMQNVRQRGSKGTFYVVQNVPMGARSAFEGKAQVWISLRTTDRSEARSKAVPILADLEGRISAALSAGRAMAPPEIVSTARVPISRAHAIAALERWRTTTIDADFHATINGLDLPSRLFSGQERAALQTNRFGDADGWRAILVQALGSQGIVADVEHPALAFLAQPFALAALSVDHWRERFGLGLIDGWPDHFGTPESKPVPQATTTAGMTISQLRDAWDAVKPLEPKQKGYIRRLIEFLGDVDIASVQPLQLDRFLIELRRFPLSKRPEDDKLGFGELIAKYEGKSQKLLNERTVYLWTTVYKAMFAFAVSLRVLSHNPAEAMMRKPSIEIASERVAFDEADLKIMFATPLYRGHSGRLVGNRDQPGDVVIRDDHYWLPIAALFTGMRLEELASLKRTEIVRENGIVAFDLRDRPLTGANRVKNRAAKRLIPISTALEKTGFLAWVESGEGEYVFSDLKPNASGKRGTKFGKWFARWCAANAPVKGEGIDDPDKPFHSFRHTFKRCARESHREVSPEISDLITGHSEGNLVARGYGRGVDLATLKAAIDLIRFPNLGL